MGVIYEINRELKDHIMDPQNIIAFVSNLIEQHRVEIGERPQTTPVEWNGIHMTVDEAKMAIKGLEEAKREHQQDMNGAQIGGEITKLAVGGTGLAAMVTGAALLVFPPTTLAGVAVLASGVGATGIGAIVGDGIKSIGTNNGTQNIRQIDAYINSIKNAIIDSI